MSAIFCAIWQLLQCHLLQKIPTVIDAGVGGFFSSHVRAVISGKVDETLHDVADKSKWVHTYIKMRFRVPCNQKLDSQPPNSYPLRFYLVLHLMGDNIRRALQNINLGIEDAPVTLPQAIVQQAAAENRFCLIGRPLMPRKQNLRQIIASLPRSWGLVGFVRGRIIEQRRFQFVFPSEESLETVMRRGPWSFADRMLVLERWDPELDPLPLNAIPFWIQIRGIPLQYMNLGVIDRIARSLCEDVMEVDFDEATVIRVQFVRVRLNWNVANPLRFQRNFQFTPGVNTVLSFFYERLRGFCEVCGLLTHDSGNCLIQNGGPDNSDDDDGNEDGDYAMVGNPGIQIQEIGEDGQPIVDNEEAEEALPVANPEVNVEERDVMQAVAESDGEGNLSDIDPDHNSLEEIPSGNFQGMFRGEWINEEDVLYNPIPSFANATGDIPGSIGMLTRELRKRKQMDEAESSTARKRKVEVENQTGNLGRKEDRGSGGNSNNDRDRAEVGPVPPNDP